MMLNSNGNVVAINGETGLILVSNVPKGTSEQGYIVNAGEIISGGTIPYTAVTADSYPTYEAGGGDVH